MATLIALPLTHQHDRAGINPESVRLELQRILESKTFRTADGQKNFLRFVVENTLAGLADQIKEMSIGIEVFDRGINFDPRLDTIVRVEARKLRARLARYYETEGSSSPVRIVLPPRGYVPTFHLVGAATQTDEPSVPIAAAVTKPVVAAAETAETTSLPDLTTGTPRRWPFILFAALGLIGVIGTIAVVGKVRSARSASPSIAVLPFRNLGEMGDDSVSDGLADELIDLLTQVRGLRVMARTSAFQFRNRDTDVRDIGRQLNVQMVLVGSIAKYGNRLRINAQLVDANRGWNVWSRIYERDTSDILGVQKEIADAIVDEFRRTPAISERLGPAPTNQSSAVNPEAYRDYLLGVYFFNKNTSNTLKNAIDYFQQAVTKDPRYARAWAGLARSYVALSALSGLPARQAADKIQEMAAKSLALDPEQGESHIYLGYAGMLMYDWPTAESEFTLGLAREPGNALGHRWFANYLLVVGAGEKALAENKVAQDLDPASPYMAAGTAKALYCLGRIDESMAYAKRILLLDPNYGVAHEHLADAYIEKRMFPEAIAEMRIAQDEMGNDATRTAMLGYTYAVSGRTAEARQIFNQLLNAPQKSPRALGVVSLGLGDKDRAFEYLQEAVTQSHAALLVKLNPIYSSLRSDKRYPHLLALMGLR